MTSTTPGRADPARPSLPGTGPPGRPPLGSPTGPPLGPPAGPSGGPAGGGHRAGRHPAPGPGTGAPRRARPGLTLVGLPVATLVAVEVVLLCALLVAQKKVVVGIVAVAVGVIVIVAALLRLRGVRVGTWVALRAAYVLRQRETLVAAAEYARGQADGPDLPDGRGPRHGSVLAPAGTAPRPNETIDLAPELQAFFPGMSVWEGRTHDDDRMGVVQWRGMCSASIRIGPGAGIVRSRNTADNIPIEAILGSVDAGDLALDCVQLLTQTIVGEQDPAQTPLVGTSSAELLGGRPRVRNRSSFVTVRVDPVSAAAAVAVRGGGTAGIARLLSAALSHIRSAAVAAGLEVDVLDAGEANRAVAESLYHQATPYDPIIRWVESVRGISSTRMAHRSFVVNDARRPAISEMTVGNVFAYAVSTQALPRADRAWATRTTVRLTCRSTESLILASRELRGVARRSGIGLQALDAVQYLGIRATVPIGGA